MNQRNTLPLPPVQKDESFFMTDSTAEQWNYREAKKKKELMMIMNDLIFFAIRFLPHAHIFFIMNVWGAWLRGVVGREVV